MTGINITHSVESFRNIITCSWEYASKLAHENSFLKEALDDTFLDCWMQATWEMIVECSIDPEQAVILEIYGNGADYNKVGSRIWRPTAIPNHQVHCAMPEGRQIIDMLLEEVIEGPVVLDAFCTIKNDWISYGPPFDHIEIQGDQTRVIGIEGIKYTARPFCEKSDDLELR